MNQKPLTSPLYAFEWSNNRVHQNGFGSVIVRPIAIVVNANVNISDVVRYAIMSAMMVHLDNKD